MTTTIYTTEDRDWEQTITFYRNEDGRYRFRCSAGSWIDLDVDPRWIWPEATAIKVNNFKEKQ